MKKCGAQNPITALDGALSCAYLDAVADDSFENMPVGIALPIGKLHRANVFRRRESTEPNTMDALLTAIAKARGWIDDLFELLMFDIVNAPFYLTFLRITDKKEVPRAIASIIITNSNIKITSKLIIITSV